MRVGCAGRCIAMGLPAVFLLAACAPTLPSTASLQGAARAGTSGPYSASAPPGASPECEQIATELLPYVQQMRPGITSLNDTGAELRARASARAAAAAPTMAALGLASAAAGALPVGGNAAGGAIGMAMTAMQQEQRRVAEAEDRPLTEQMNAQATQLVGQSQQLQSDPRFQQLMQAGAANHCY
jgi:hypothetical protein